MTTVIYCLLNRSDELTFGKGESRFWAGDVTLSWDETADWSILTEYVDTRALLSK